MPKVTEAFIKGLTAPAKGNQRFFEENSGGFGVRITSKGYISFIYRYRLQGRQYLMTLGHRYPQSTISQARRLHKEAHALVAEGINPLEQEREERRMPSVKEFWEVYRDTYSKHHHALLTQSQLIGRMEKHALPAIGKTKMNQVSRQQIRKMQMDLADLPAAANNLMLALSGMFNYAVDQGVLDSSPVRGIKYFKMYPRERWMSKEEVSRFLEAVDTLKNREVALAFRLLLFTGARKMEVLSAQWTDLDLEKALWTKAARSTKQKRIHHVPLNSEALMTLEELQASKTGDAAFLFPAKKGGHRRSLDYQWKMIKERAELEDICIHDLRHTFASHLASNGVALPLIKDLLGHSRIDTTMRYAHLSHESLVEATNHFGKVVALRPERKQAS